MIKSARPGLTPFIVGNNCCGAFGTGCEGKVEDNCILAVLAVNNELLVSSGLACDFKRPQFIENKCDGTRGYIGRGNQLSQVARLSDIRQVLFQRAHLLNVESLYILSQNHKNSNSVLQTEFVEGALQLNAHEQ